MKISLTLLDVNLLNIVNNWAINILPCRNYQGKIREFINPCFNFMPL